MNDADLKIALLDQESAIDNLLDRVESLEHRLTKLIRELAPKPAFQYPFSDPPNPSIKYISVHHSASPMNVTRADVIKWHTANGWPDVRSGYHVFIQADGSIEWGSMDAVLKYTVGQQNPHTLGVCLAGNFHPPDKGFTGRPKIKQLESLRLVLKVWKERYPDASVVPHRRFGGTVCPGDLLAEWVETNHAG
jgi:hypothetical protein